MPCPTREDSTMSMHFPHGVPDGITPGHIGQAVHHRAHLATRVLANVQWLGIVLATTYIVGQAWPTLATWI
jgi:hypothetical protein